MSTVLHVLVLLALTAVYFQQRRLFTRVQSAAKGLPPTKPVIDLVTMIGDGDRYGSYDQSNPTRRMNRDGF